VMRSKNPRITHAETLAYAAGYEAGERAGREEQEKANG
jgi:hypothetical protein